MRSNHPVSFAADSYRVFLLASGAAALCCLVPTGVRAQSGGYAIITTTNIVAESIQLTNFVAWKQSLGYDVQVIDNSTNGWGGGVGDTAAEHIRSWLQQHYMNTNHERVLDYVLLIGDPRPDIGDVPMKLCDPSDRNVPTDYYYAELTADWDGGNTNSHYGEWIDFTNNVEALNQTEVYVGRIPYYGQIVDLDHILGKLVTYEQAGRRDIWRQHRALLAMDEGTDAYEARIGELIKNQVLNPVGWGWHRVYDYQPWGADPPEILGCSASTVVPAWTNYKPDAVFWISHGTPTDTPDAIGIAGSQIIAVSNVPSLDDKAPVFTFQCSCLNAHPETTNNLAYSLLKHGAVSTVGATRDSFIYDSDPWADPCLAHGILFYYAGNLVSRCMPAARSLQCHKMAHLPTAERHWQCYIEFNVYGDPSMAIYMVHFPGAMWGL